MVEFNFVCIYILGFEMEYELWWSVISYVHVLEGCKFSF